MSETRDVIIVGAGHNGLITAFYLAKAGFKAAGPGTSSRRSAAAPLPKNFIPAFAAPVSPTAPDLCRSDIVADMNLLPARA